MMKEIKYLSHFLRNIYIFSLFVFSVSLINKTQLDVYQMIIGLVTYFISYLPIYFINDYSDHLEDKIHDKANIFEKIPNKLLFWSIPIIAVSIGIILTIKASLTALLLLLLIYIFNLLYSLKPFKLRNRQIIREFTIFIIYFLKILYLGSLIYSSVTALPIILIVMSASTGAFSVSLYKRHNSRSKISEFIFGSLFVLSWALAEIFYKQTFWLFLPLLPALLFLMATYKKKQIPIGVYQTLYFFYTVFVYFIFRS